MTDRWIELDGLVNMRDLGGLPTRDGGTVAPGRLIRSDNLQDLSEADVSRLVDELGVTDVVDLRSETELHLSGPGPLREVESLTHHHHSLLAAKQPEQSTDDVARQALPTRDEAAAEEAPREEPVRDAAFWAGHYLGYLANRPDSVAAALDVVARAEGPVVVHCAAGKDRTGTVIALALDIAGVPREEIVADYVLSAERIEAIIGRLVPLEPYGKALKRQKIADQTPQAETIEKILAALDERWGGAAGFLREHGWTDADVERLRVRLTA